MPLSLDGTGSIVGIVTVSVSDDLAHVGDTNTKISFPANDTISFETNGAERLRITSAGKIGIGTDNPKQPVSINNGRVSIDVRGDYYGAWIDGDTQGTSSFNVGRWHNAGGRMRSGGSNDNDLIVETQNTAHNLQLQPTGGKIGIGTDNPSKALHVFKSNEHPVILERGDNSNTQIELRTGGAIRGYWGCSNTANFMVYDNDTSDINFTVLQTGKVGIGTDNPTTQLQVNHASNESTISLYNGGTKKSAFQAQNSFGTILYSYGEPLIFSVASSISFSRKVTIDTDGRLFMGGASTIHGSTNADDLVIGANNQSNQTGITLGSASASSIRFADAADDTAGSVYYGHGDDIMRFYAGSNQRFTINGSTATASASIMTATIFRSGGPGGGLGITMGGLAAGSGSQWVDTGISVNASNGGRTMMILGSRNTGAGYSTQAYMWLIRFAYDGNNIPSVHNVTGNSSFWSIRVSSSNTFEINGNSGNWQFGGVYVN